MWCTRWFLPLLIIPLPTASPFFLTIFLISVTLQARPCFYCIVLLTILFSSTCYWQPMSTNTLLTKPIGDATTFGEAITAGLSTYDEESRFKYAPAMIQLLDRCWCDFGLRLWPSGDEGDEWRGSSDLFSPRDVAQWEKASVNVARKEYTKKLKGSVAEKDGNTIAGEVAPGEEDDGPIVSDQPEAVNDTQSSSEPPFLWRLWDGIFQSKPSSLNHSNLEQPSTKLGNHTTEVPTVPSEQSWFRREYDLRKHGIDIVIDFSWNRGN